MHANPRAIAPLPRISALYLDRGQRNVTLQSYWHAYHPVVIKTVRIERKVQPPQRRFNLGKSDKVM
jgi:hypothetical protein